MENRENLWAIVLAAGNGRRLAPFLRRRGHQRPKQFCAILGQRTMLEHTWKRVEMIVPRERVVTVVDAAQPQLREPFERIRHALGTNEATMTIRRAYETMPCISLSKGVFERRPARLAALAVRDVYWSDWGCEDRVNETLRQFAPNMATSLFPTEAAFPQ